jgi:hypothetical protein
MYKQILIKNIGTKDWAWTKPKEASNEISIGEEG